MLFLSSANVFFFKINIFKNFFQEHYQSAKWFGSRSGGHLLVLIWTKLFAKVISRWLLLSLERITCIKSIFGPAREIMVLIIYGPQREKTCLRGFANNKCADQPAHPRRLISAFVIPFMESTICKLATGDISIL